MPRDYYHYNYEERRAAPGEAYEDTPKPWAIGYGSALSDYLGQAYMTQIAKPQPGEVSLEIGTGSGFQSSILSRIVRRAYSIEIIAPLGHAVAKIFAPLGYDNIETRVGDGYYGWPEVRGRLRHHHADLRRAVRAARPVQAAEAGRADDHPHRPAVQARADPLHLHQGREREDPLQAGHGRVLHPHDRRDDGEAAPGRDAGGRARRAASPTSVAPPAAPTATRAVPPRRRVRALAGDRPRP